jgi:hypothetical protein
MKNIDEFIAEQDNHWDWEKETVHQEDILMGLISWARQIDQLLETMKKTRDDKIKSLEPR